MDDKIWLRDVCRRHGIEISDCQLDLLQAFSEQLLQSNRKVNLISRKDEIHIWKNHILPSVALLFKFQLHPRSAVLDLGTGGGLPGIPLSILTPGNRFLLVDSIQKKIRAVKNIVEDLKLTNVSIECARAEALGGLKKHQRAFDYVITRAVASVKDIITWSKPFLRGCSDNEEKSDQKNSQVSIPRGTILLLKGGLLDEDIQEAALKLRPKQIAVYPITINGPDVGSMVGKKLVIVRP